MSEKFSTERMHYKGDRSQKAYRGHVQERNGRYHVWTTYGPADHPDRQTFDIGVYDTLAQAAAALNAKIRTKMKTYSVPAGAAGSGLMDASKVDKPVEIARGNGGLGRTFV